MGFQLTEMYRREDFQSLEQPLRLLMAGVIRFPGFDLEDGYRNLAGFLARANTATSPGSWINLGYALKNGGDTPLPPGIAALDLSLQHLLPSTVALSLFARLEPQATTRLNAILDRVYTEADAAAPSGGFYAPASVKALDVRNHFWALRRSVEDLIAKYCPGVFLSLDRGDLPVCPATDVLSLPDIPIGDDEATAQWTIENLRFLYCIGVEGMPSLVTRWHEYLLFHAAMLMMRDAWDRSTEHALRVLSSTGVFEDNPERRGSRSPESALLHHLREPLTYLGYVYGLSHLVTLDSDAVAELRAGSKHGTRYTQQGAESLRELRDRFSQLVPYMTAIRARSFNVARLRRELQSHYQVLATMLPEFAPIETRPGSAKYQYPLALLDSLDGRLSLLLSEMTMLEDLFAADMTVTNADLNLRLGLRMNKLTVLIAILATASTVIAAASLAPILLPAARAILSLLANK